MQKVLLALTSAALLAHAAAAQTAVPLDSLRARGARALQARRYAEATTLLQQQLTAEPHQGQQASTAYNLACAYALLGQPKPALKALAQAERLGYHDAAWARQDTDLTSLHPQPGFQQVLARMDAANARLADPTQAQLVTADIPRFWRAYDLAARDTAHAVQIYQHEYFGKASPGLQDYFDLKMQSVPEFLANQRRKPRYYRSIRRLTLRIDSMAPQIRAGFVRLKELYPEARFPNVYFVIGSWTSGGTVSGHGMLIGADMQCRAPGVNESELSLWERNNIGRFANLPSLVSHEHIHYLQHLHQGKNDPSLLRGAINEGMADFLAELAAGHNPNARLQAYGLAHEADIWAAFTKEMAGSDWHNWIGNASQETADKPADLGYFVGYRICQRYYQQAADKKQAIHDLLNIQDYPAFLARSGYAGK